ncbi:MAG: O-antigen ligase family protein [Aeromicrobium sp.]
MSTLTRPKVKAGVAGWLASGFVVAVAFSYFETFSLFLIGLLALVAAANLCFTLHIHRYALLAAAFVIFVFFIGASIGSVPESLARWPGWINRDGRVVVALLPVILLGATRIRLPDLTMTVRTLEVVVLVNAPVFIAGLVGVPIIDQVAFARNTFSGLMSSHHAAGMVFGAAVIIMAAARRSPSLGIKPHLGLIVGALVLAVGSGSRTAVVGLVAAALWLAYERKRLSEVLRVTAAVALLGGLAIVLNEKLAGTVASFLSPDLWIAAWQQFTIGMGSTESVHYAGGSAGLEEGYIANILGRFFYWGIAIGMWLRSPLVGIGSFRFNDVDMSFTGINGFIQVATSGADRSDDLIGAHNQYLGVLVENGLLGLVLLLAIWILPFRHIGKRIWPPPRIRESGRQMVPFALATAVTGYTLVSPALTFVCLTWLTLVFMCDEDPP